MDQSQSDSTNIPNGTSTKRTGLSGKTNTGPINAAASKNPRRILRIWNLRSLFTSTSMANDFISTTDINYFSIYSSPNVPAPQLTDTAGDACLK